MAQRGTLDSHRRDKPVATMKIAPVGAGTMHLPDAAGAPVVVSEAPVSAVQPVAAVTERKDRYRHMNVAVGVLAVIALVAALYLARAFVVPLLIGVLASYA